MPSWERRRQRGALALLRVKQYPLVRVPESALNLCTVLRGGLRPWMGHHQGFQVVSGSSGWRVPAVHTTFPAVTFLTSMHAAAGSAASHGTKFRLLLCSCNNATRDRVNALGTLYHPTLVYGAGVYPVWCIAAMARASSASVCDRHGAKLLGWQGAMNARAAVRLLSVQGLCETRRFRGWCIIRS